MTMGILKQQSAHWSCLNGKKKKKKMKNFAKGLNGRKSLWLTTQQRALFIIFFNVK